MRYETLIFDLDGTISDPFVGISRSINYALEALRFETVDAERVRPMIGPPLTEIFKHFVGPVSDSVLRQLVDKYRECYASSGYAENTVYPEIPDIIARLADCGYTLGICTSKRADYAERIVQMFGLSQHFSFIDGGDFGVHKWQQIERLIANGLKADSAVMIGDRSFDITAGQHGALSTVGVLWGFGDREELELAAPDHLLQSPVELLNLFDPEKNQ
jgi:phosphoglycolate phosphatase